MEEHSHEDHRHVSPQRVVWAGVATILAAAVELYLSFRGHSLFLVADALHLVAHLGIFLVLLLPVHGAHAKREDGATITILILVILIASGIGVASVRSLLKPEPGEKPEAAVMLASILGLVANILSAWLFRDPAKALWSFRAALAHELSDGGLTIAGLLGAGAIRFMGWDWVDRGLSLAIVAWLWFWAGRLLVRRVRLGREGWAVDAHAHHDP